MYFTTCCHTLKSKKKEKKEKETRPPFRKLSNIFFFCCSLLLNISLCPRCHITFGIFRGPPSGFCYNLQPYIKSRCQCCPGVTSLSAAWKTQSSGWAAAPHSPAAPKVPGSGASGAVKRSSSCLWWVL